ncbi:hypothetical protein BHAOGJBA_5132 [Methylobacterium hispanicum]|uniref:Polymer-forming cytoskeletal protein n=1 Tax=Methylobacterium hispanicum TaxID=270350 RepID=A0AAV4ZTW2_9HYPH|nr:polymer-forming cytoskeletal protein [Methylobacterium hispanicum]GJD91584.1 hypothetical protein BHAOGJBA_5132 [Methylobacterium hispanicum]
MTSATTTTGELAVLRVGPHSKQRGDLVHDGLVLVEGTAVGRIHAREVRVLSGGCVDGVIHADVAKFMGSFRGSVRAVAVLIGAGSEIQDADIICESMGMEIGATFEIRSARKLAPNAVPRFDYQTSMARLNPAVPGQTGFEPRRATLSVVEGGGRMQAEFPSGTAEARPLAALRG